MLTALLSHLVCLLAYIFAHSLTSRHLRSCIANQIP